MKKETQILFLSLYKLFLIVLCLVNGFTVLINDEAYRSYLAFMWGEHPFFSPDDHVWLGGHFYITGIFFLLFKNLDFYVTLKLLTITLSLLSVIGFYLLMYVLFSNSAISFFTTLLYATGYYHTWHSCANLAGIYVDFFVSFGLAGLFYGLKNRKNKFILIGAAFLGIATSFRYEVWVWNLSVFGILFLYSIFKNKKIELYLIFVGILLFIYPFLWGVSCYLDKGDFFLFLKSSNKLSIMYKSLYTSKLTYALTLYYMERFLILFLMFLGIIVSFLTKNEMLLLLSIIDIVFTIIFSYTSKIGSAADISKVVQLWRLTLFPFVGAVFFAVFQVTQKINLSNNIKKFAPKLITGLMVITFIFYFKFQIPMMLTSEKYTSYPLETQFGKLLRSKYVKEHSSKNINNILFIGDDFTPFAYVWNAFGYNNILQVKSWKNFDIHTSEPDIIIDSVGKFHSEKYKKIEQFNTMVVFAKSQK